jgi:hypothetical protein
VIKLGEYEKNTNPCKYLAGQETSRAPNDKITEKMPVLIMNLTI